MQHIHFTLFKKYKSLEDLVQKILRMTVRRARFWVGTLASSLLVSIARLFYSLQQMSYLVTDTAANQPL